MLFIIKFFCLLHQNLQEWKGGREIKREKERYKGKKEISKITKN